MIKDEILKTLANKGDLPPLPEILLSLQNLINDPDCDLEAIAELVETEPVLSGRLMKLANSVLFGGGRDEAEDLSSAVMRLGIKMILDLAYTLQLPNMFNRLKSFDQYLFWKHSLAVACLTQILSRKAGLSEQDQAESYVCGLMHDLGIVVYEYLIPKEYGDFVKSSDSEGASLEILEKEKFGIDHSELGGRFIRTHWSLSPVVISSVANHHQPLSVNGAKPNLPQLVCIANRLVCNRGITHGVGDEPEAAPEDSIFENLGVSVEEFEEIFAEMLHGLDGAEEVLKGT